MGENSAISWTDDTFNPWEGCQKVSPACDGCYAEARNLRYAPQGTTEAPNWGPHAPRRRTSASNWNKPRKWDREQAAHIHNCSLVGDKPEPRFVFCASLADVFDNAVPAEWRRDLFDLIRATPNLTWLLLTKRPGNIVKLWAETFADESGTPLALTSDFWPRNAAIGFTAVTQPEMDRDSRHALAAFRALNPPFLFWSGEPLLGPVDVPPELLALGGGFWAITGGETDQGAHKARPSHPQWFRDIRDQCAAAGVPYHHKQNGEWASVSEAEGLGGEAFHTFDDFRTVRRLDKARAGRLLDGMLHDARP